MKDQFIGAKFEGFDERLAVTKDGVKLDSSGTLGSLREGSLRKLR
jgi:hypothetical protein